MRRVLWILLGVVLGLSVSAATVVALRVWPVPESRHDRDLRECMERWNYATRYSEPSAQADAWALVEACMRGRGW